MDASLLRMIAAGQFGQGPIRRIVPTFGEELIVETTKLNVELAIPASAIDGVEEEFPTNLEKIGLLAAEVAYQLQPKATKMILGDSTFQWEEIPKPQGVFIFHGQAKPGKNGWRLDVYIKTKEEGTPKIIGFGSSSLNPAPSQRKSKPPVGSSSMSPAASARGMSPPPPRPPTTSLKRASSSLQMTRDSKIRKELEAVAQQEATSSTRPTTTRPPAVEQIAAAEQFVRNLWGIGPDASSPPSWLLNDGLDAPMPAADVMPREEPDVQELKKMMAVNVLSHSFLELEAVLREKGIEALYVTREIIPIKMPSRSVFFFSVTPGDFEKLKAIMMKGKEWALKFSIGRWENCKESFFAPAVSMMDIIETFFLSQAVLIESGQRGTPYEDDWTYRLQNKGHLQRAFANGKLRQDVFSRLNARGRKMFEELKQRENI